MRKSKPVCGLACVESDGGGARNQLALTIRNCSQQQLLFSSCPCRPVLFVCSPTSVADVALKMVHYTVEIFNQPIYIYKHIYNNHVQSIYLQQETYLYDPKVLQQLDFHRSPAKFQPFISAANPGEPWMKVRPLKDTDYDRGFLQLLSQLTHVGNVTRTQFLSK